MAIHVVSQGETISFIARLYGVTVESIIKYNELSEPDNLVPGQTIVILSPDKIHTVAEGETLESIAKSYGVTVINLLQNNPYLNGVPNINAGEELVINFLGEKKETMSVLGYVYPTVNKDTLIKTLPFLTYILIFTYGIKPNGDLIPINDEEIIRISKDYGVAPIMQISTLTEEGVFSNEISHIIVNDMQVQNRVIENVLSNLKAKGYYGLDIDFEYVFPEDKANYTWFIKRITDRLNMEGYIVFTALAPKTSVDQKGLLYEAHDYMGIGHVSNYVLLMTYEWGYAFGPPMAVAPLNKVEEVVSFAVTQIMPDFIYLGIPNYGYDWPLPFVSGTTRAKSISNVEAVDIARTYGVNIEYDYTSQAPFFNYVAEDGVEHVVWFEDARSIQAKVQLVPYYGLNGVGYWNLMRYFPQNWLVVNYLFNIRKVL